ncbi:MAG TPA: hypothetical protein DD452_02075 [Nitrospina sp.]|jgi:hypothetical protein|nr:hypothetical protein [Nitrospina sp.]|tara:strand:- start:3931 stop:4671 length:741 start_codon:yes stop_codon:yes gene_type:complete
MSTILETLKKLEEDKRLLEKDLDLKELVLQEDHKPRKLLKISSKKFVPVGQVVVGVLIGLALVWGLKPSAKNEVAPFSQANPAQKPPSVYKKRFGATMGIPLSNISEQEQRYEENVSENLPPVIETFAPPPVLGIRESFAESEAQGINEIRDLIQTAKLAAEQAEPFTYPAELATRGISIPHLKVKGIIFFSQGSSSNHIFVATSESNNRKVRVGDTVQSATLTYIESNRVVFSYRGENVHLRIGE